MGVRLVVLTGTCAVGKSTLAGKLAARLGAGVPVFHIDDYIPSPPPPGYASDWPSRRVGYLPEIGRRIKAALGTGRLAIFEGVLTKDLEVPTLAKFAGLQGLEVLIVVINRSAEECWLRKSHEAAFQKQYPFIESVADFRRCFYDGYLPVEVVADLTLDGVEVDGDVGVERVVRRIGARA